MTLALAAAALLAVPTVLAFFAGGYFEVPRLTAAVGVWALVLMAAVAAPVPLPRRRAARVALGGIVLLAAWTGASISWAPLAGPATADFQRVLLYAGAFAAGIALLRAAPTRRFVEPALAGGALIAIGYGLSGRLVPGVVDQNPSRGAFGRLDQPLTYWNATGALAAIGFVLCVRIAGDETRGQATRAAAAAGAVPLAVGTYLSFSRGALAAALIGCVALAALVRSRGQLRALAIALALGAVASLVANALPAVRELEGSASARTREGLVMLAALALLAGLAAALQRLSDPRRDRLLALGAAILAVGAATVVAIGDEPPQKDVRGADAARLGSLETNRGAYWSAALEGFSRAPVRGLGAGGFRVEWLRDREILERTQDAHSLYLETLCELGLVGFALLATWFAGVGVAARRAWRLDPARAAGPVAAVLVFAVHAGLDWDWEMPAVTLVAVLLAATLAGIADDDAPDAADEAAEADRAPLAVPA